MKRIALLLIASAIVYATFFTEKDRLDREVKRLCAIDGGVKVYETVKLPPERFDQYGQIRLPSKRLIKPGDEYYYEAHRNQLIQGNPEVFRSHSQVYRTSDSRLLGETVAYIRRGGDMPGPWHDSSFMCPEKADLIDLKKLIFISNQGVGS